MLNNCVNNTNSNPERWNNFFESNPDFIYDKKYIHDAVRDGYSLKYVPEKFQDDYDIVETAVLKSGLNLEYASHRLKNNGEIVVEAVYVDGKALQFASRRLQNKKIIVKDAVLNNGIAFQYATPKLRDDENFIFELFTTNDDMFLDKIQLARGFQFVNECFKRNKDFIMKIMEVNCYIYPYISEDLKKDKDIYTGKECQLFQYFPTELKNDRDLVSIAISQNGMALQFASTDLQNDKDMVSFAISQNGMALKFASSDIQNQRDMVSFAISQNGMALQFASTDLQNDRDMVSFAISQNGMALQFASSIIQDDDDFVLSHIKKSPGIIRYCSSRLQQDKSFILKSINTNRQLYSWLDKLNDDEDIILVSIKKLNRHFQHIPKKILTKEFIYNCLEVNKNIFPFINEDLKNDECFILDVLRKFPSLFEKIPKIFQESEAFIIKSFENNSEITPFIIKKHENNVYFLENVLKNIEHKKFILKLVNTQPALFRHISDKYKQDEYFIREENKKNSSNFKYGCVYRCLEDIFRKYHNAIDDKKIQDAKIFNNINQLYRIFHGVDAEIPPYDSEKWELSLNHLKGLFEYHRIPIICYKHYNSERIYANKYYERWESGMKLQMKSTLQKYMTTIRIVVSENHLQYVISRNNCKKENWKFKYYSLYHDFLRD